jgi:hypothetical protein
MAILLRKNTAIFNFSDIPGGVPRGDFWYFGCLQLLRPMKIPNNEVASVDFNEYVKEIIVKFSTDEIFSTRMDQFGGSIPFHVESSYSADVFKLCSQISDSIIFISYFSYIIQQVHFVFIFNFFILLTLLPVLFVKLVFPSFFTSPLVFVIFLCFPTCGSFPFFHFIQ